MLYNAKKYAKTQDRYAELAAHYAFRTDFCNPSEGHEKGLVENLVEYARNNFLVPVPRVESLAELNRCLAQECQTYNDTHKIRDREFSVAQMLSASCPASSVPGKAGGSETSCEYSQKLHCFAGKGHADCFILRRLQSGHAGIEYDPLRKL